MRIKFDNSIVRGCRENMINKTNVLIIQEDLNLAAEITEKCIEAGISEKNIFSVTDADSAERYLEIAGISYVIIDAEMYNFVVASLIERFSEYFPIKILITGSNPEQRTLRMMSDKSLIFIDSYEELADVLCSRTGVYSDYSNTSAQ